MCSLQDGGAFFGVAVSLRIPSCMESWNGGVVAAAVAEQQTDVDQLPHSNGRVGRVVVVARHWQHSTGQGGRSCCCKAMAAAFYWTLINVLIRRIEWQSGQGSGCCKADSSTQLDRVDGVAVASWTEWVGWWLL